MKCPFELPVRKRPQPEDGFYKIKDAQQRMIACGLDEDEADYIVQVINSHEKLVELLRYANDLPMNECGDYEKNCKWAIEAEQALKEAEGE